jgi:formate--tetrahydrofolate ligase
MESLMDIFDLTSSLGLSTADVEPRGWQIGKFAPGLVDSLQHRSTGKYIGVTAINPTPFGEGKTVVTIGLAMALRKLGKNAICTLREPSLAPVFGIKGGGAGGGKSTLVPQTEINLHFTGDLHAIAASNNLLAALIDNHVRRRRDPRIDETTITWRRCVDMCDKGLSQIVTGLGNQAQAPVCETGFDLTAASEVMAILALAENMQDLRQRIGAILVGTTPSGEAVTVNDLGAAGAMTALLKDALRPNLVQTCEGTPAIVHAGPFANIAHGNSSVLGDRIALRLADYVVTESGFGSDLGAEKLIHIKCRNRDFSPAVEVLVCTVRALKFHSGRFDVRPGKPLPEALLRENCDALKQGIVNLEAHLDILKAFGVPAIVAINRYPTDTNTEIELLRTLAIEKGASQVAVTDAFARGGEGSLELAEAVVRTCQSPDHAIPMYPLSASLSEKLDIVARRVYGAEGIELSPHAERQLHRYTDLGFGEFPVCVAKTQYSLSHNSKLLGRPRGFRIPIQEARVAAGAGFVYTLAGDIMTMPGLPSQPAALRIDVDATGSIRGM